MVPAGYAHLMVPMEGILSYTAYGRYTLLYIITRCCSGVKERCRVAPPVSHSVSAKLGVQLGVKWIEHKREVEERGLSGSNRLKTGSNRLKTGSKGVKETQ
jgi:hypothetical protein